ncbi:MAG: lipid-A-disaccharide synthase N-terminal domain-containing protein [Planctomycetota bacterium]|jgi:lipid-A-disaccharide synthase-like uncharacterized protein|nr:lipid-A-disaccharide synthase N-terminal domain-containing protein [Planctomycetota bacterium]
MFSGMRWDTWELFGLVGEGLFFARLVAQWLASEKAKKPVIPVVYWYFSLAGAIILVLYALHIGSFAVLIPQAVGVFFYGRGLHLEYTHRRAEERRRELGLDRPDYSWPRMSVIIPAHNEEKSLADTLRPLVDQNYPGPKPEIVAALNGCTDGSRAAAERFPVTVKESEHSGMSFGKNLGAATAYGDMLVFVDADTRLPENGLRLLAEAASGKARYIGTVAGAPDRGGLVVRICFAAANRVTKRRRAHAPGGVMLMDKGTFTAIGGFDESLPQGTSTDCIWRGLKAGAEYVFVDSFAATTSIRRFEKTGIIRQMFDWRKNHQALSVDRRDEVAQREYDNSIR